jgi:cytochrome c peroxidase
MLSIISDQSKYDRVRRSQDQFTPIEQKGYELFKTNCSTCHQEPLLTRNDFQRNGITNNGSELGRFRITQLPQDSFAFKVPTLRNVELTYPYMHNGRIRTLKEVLDAYNNADRSHAPNLPAFHLDENQKQIKDIQLVQLVFLKRKEMLIKKRIRINFSYFKASL